MIDSRFVRSSGKAVRLGDMIPGSISKAVLISLLTAIGAGAQSTEPPEVSAARVCAEGYKLYEQKQYAEAEARFLTGTLKSEKATTGIHGGCLVLLARTQEKVRRG